LLPTIAPLDLPQVVVVEIDPSGVADSPYERFLAAGSPEPVQSWLQDEEEPISINYTSGTTDRPKGVLYSHRGAYLNALGEVVEAGLRSDSVYLRRAAMGDGGSLDPFIDPHTWQRHRRRG